MTAANTVPEAISAELAEWLTSTDPKKNRTVLYYN